MNTTDDGGILVEVVEDARAYLGDWLPRAQLVKLTAYAIGYAEQLGRFSKSGDGSDLAARAETQLAMVIASEDMICHGEVCCTTWRRRRPYEWMSDSPKVQS